MVDTQYREKLFCHEKCDVIVKLISCDENSTWFDVCLMVDALPEAVVFASSVCCKTMKAGEADGNMIPLQARWVPSLEVDLPFSESVSEDSLVHLVDETCLTMLFIVW